MKIRFDDNGSGYRLRGKGKVRAWLTSVAACEGYAIDGVGYIFSSSERMLDMNRQFLGHDYYTDVITFEYGDRKRTCAVSGEVFIDTETVADNARLYGSTEQEEMLRVIVHGLLHLCGQKDKSPTAAKRMRAKENRYLRLWRKSYASPSSPHISRKTA